MPLTEPADASEEQKIAAAEKEYKEIEVEIAEEAPRAPEESEEEKHFLKLLKSRQFSRSSDAFGNFTLTCPALG